MSAAASPANAEEIFTRALELHQRGQFVEAERLYRDAIALQPNHVDALHLLGLLGLQTGRNELAVEFIGRAIAQNDTVADFHHNLAEACRRLGRNDDALRHFTSAATLDPNFADAYQNLGGMQLALGNLDAALPSFQKVLTLQPNRPDALLGLAETFRLKTMPLEALTHYQRAIAAKPDYLPALHALMRFRIGAGEFDDALLIARNALQFDESPDTRALFLLALTNARNVPNDPVLRRALIHALVTPWTRPGDLAALCTQLVKSGGAVGESIARLAAPGDKPLSIEELFGPQGLRAIANDELLRTLLQIVPICDAELERLLTVMRILLLQAATSAPDQPMPPELTLFYAALARQCFLNGYVFARNEHEDSLLTAARDALATALRTGTPAFPLLVVAVAAYAPLSTVEGIEQLIQRPTGDAIAALYRQQVLEPVEEFQDRAEIPFLTDIEDDVSQRVRDQYEENPYPTWVTAAPAPAPQSFDAVMRNRFPMASFKPLDKDTIDLLIAGCGTGQHSVETAQSYPAAKVLAIDLSMASLAYARRKTRAARLTNIEYAQADILNLGDIGRSFDVIESSGVLHHLADPFKGWRVLLSLLRPDGFMRLGFYSKSARSNVRAARDFIAKGAYDPTPTGIRKARQDLINAAASDPALQHVVRSPDFFTTSACRDLLFHVQETQLTLPEIRDFLAAEGLILVGFENLPAAVFQGYQREFPGDAQMNDLDCWHRFETKHPHLFGGMYQFWVQKAG